MELQTEDGRKIFLQRGCRKELGRGPGLAWKDRTVSRRQIVLELPGDEASTKVPSSAYVEVVGPNPICILRRRNAIQGAGSKYDSHDIEFLENGAKVLLQMGDKVSLSITEPIFLTLKVSGDRKKEQKDDTCFREVSSVDELAAQAEPEGASSHDSAKLLKEGEKGDDLLEAWKSRRLAKKAGAPDCKVEGRLQQEEEDGPVERLTPAFQKDDNLNRLNQMRNNEVLEKISSKEEEEGILEAVARRKRLRFERQKEQKKRLEEVEWKQNTVDVFKASTSKDVAKVEDEMDSEQVDYSQQKHIKPLQVDPVADFGFIVEGSEFDKFKGRENGQILDWHIDKKGLADDDNEEEESSRSRAKGVRKTQPKSGSRSLYGHKEVEDEDWEGESEGEKVLVTKVKKPRREIELQTRLRHHSGSNSDEQGKRSPKKAKKLEDIRQKDDLTGFIVEDDEEEVDDDEDEDEWTDDESDEELNEELEDSQHENTKDKNGLNNSIKPLCKYGSKCYRKNKKHLLEFRHA